MRKKAIQVVQLAAVMICFMLVLSARTVRAAEAGTDSGLVVSQTQQDLVMIPDKYNAGVQGELTTVCPGNTINGVNFVAGSNGSRIVLDFPYKNPQISGTVVFENLDFSEYPMWSYNEDLIEDPITVIFNNCKFSKVALGKTEANISYEFNHCSITNFSGSNAVFYACMFGKYYTDGLVPFQNVTVKDSFFCDMTSVSADSGEIHTDGTQIYGYAGVDVENVVYDNCRFELPPIDNEGSTANVNACIMLQMEYSNASSVEFTNCMVNGGGYSIFARSVKDEYTLRDVSFEGISVGCAKAHGTFYPTISDGVTMSDITETAYLYIASVWKENGETHFSVSNDTNQERSLEIYTDNGIYAYSIPACPGGSELENVASYEEMPFDIDVVIPEDCNYAVCFDTTIQGCAEQIRYMNWSGEEVVLGQEELDILYDANQANTILTEGECGKNITYTLTQSGVLELIGTGNTYAYNSAKVAPWSEYTTYIKEIRIGAGITNVGAQLFRGCSRVERMVLPESITEIGNNAFNGCSSLVSIVLPQSLVTVADYAFVGTILQETSYNGTAEQWAAVQVGIKNEVLQKNVICVMAEETPAETNILEGQCGEAITFTLSDTGVLRLTGEGATYNYNSSNTAPWSEVREQIKEVIVEEGITILGQQLFANSTAIEKVTLPEGISEIWGNAFIRCSGLKEINIPVSVACIGKYAFASTEIETAYYAGTEEQWNAIEIGAKNEYLVSAVVFE